jgi:hypothetical protein
MFTYNQSTGRLMHNDLLMGTGYAGKGEGKNNPAMEAVSCVGPIPRGAYTIGPQFDSPTHGPIAAHLSPNSGTDTHGRSGFLMHGDSVQHPGAASEGCIIQQRSVRVAVQAFRATGDDQLAVV